MTQHLYPCERCGAIGVAHYVLERLPDASYHNVRVCTACWRNAGRRESQGLTVNAPAAVQLALFAGGDAR